MIKTIDIGYAAGIFDGEGTVRLDQKGNIAVVIAMTDLDVLEKIQSAFGIGSITGPVELPSGKSIWRWGLSDYRSTASFLMTIYSLVSLRRQEKIREVLKAWKIKPLPYRSGCGTQAGYYKHRRNGEISCNECKKAAAEYNLKLYHKKKNQCIQD